MEKFNAMPAESLADDLLACLAAPPWVAAVLAGRPYRDTAELMAAASAAVGGLSWADILLALAAHLRIGERAAGDSREAAWSRAEQSAAADGAGSSALIAVNREYEERFGHVFLIFASGRSQAEILAAAEERLGNDEATERVVVQGELRKIALLRLERLLDAL